MHQHQPVSTIDAVPGKLAVHTYRHLLPYHSRQLDCWSYVTDGLMAHNQKELVVTMHYDPKDMDKPVHQVPLQFFSTVYQQAEQGNLVDAWTYSQFVMKGTETNVALVFSMAYIHPRPLPGIPLPSRALTVLFLHSDELEVFKSLGLSRVIASRIRLHSYYPVPPWSEFPQPKTIALDEMQHSILNKAPRAPVPGATITLEGNRIVFRIQAHAKRALQVLFARLGQDKPVALLPALDADADACLGWDPKQNQTTLLFAPDSARTRIGGCFVLFIPGQPVDQYRLSEDGFGLMFTKETWLRVWEMLIVGQSITVPLDKGASFSVVYL